MIEAKEIVQILKKNKIDFYTGVPDSILKSLTKVISSYNSNKHVIATNEGSAVSLGVGYHLSTKKIPAVYLQNSGLGNIVNPIVSIAHKKVYSIPMLLLIGWRGAPDIKDEIQHKIQGTITQDLLKLLDIKYEIIDEKNFKKQITQLIKFSKKKKKTVAILFKKNDLSFNNDKSTIVNTLAKNRFTRSYFLKVLAAKTKNFKIVATTGYTARELYQIKKNKKISTNNDFYMVGGMGHASMVAFGFSLFSKKKTICLDGDGSFLMHLGSAGTIGQFSKKNFKHILLNNGCHESVGGQKTIANKIKVKNLSFSLGYKNYYLIKNKLYINSTLNKFLNSKGPSLLEVKIEKGSLKNLIRINNLNEVKIKFMN